MAKKLFDLTAKTGEYQDRNSGETKARWQNVGAVMESNDGCMFIMMAAWFNPAGVPRKEGSESILLSCFEPREQGSQQQAPAPQRSAPSARQAAPVQRQAAAQNSSGFDDMEDDVPFATASMHYDMTTSKARKMARYDY